MREQTLGVLPAQVSGAGANEDATPPAERSAGQSPFPLEFSGATVYSCCMVKLILASAALAAAFAPASASTSAFAECQEDGEFIRNAALARDYGITRAAFLGRMAADFILIRVFPAELRWFTRDAQDEAFLTEAAAQVFDQPREPSVHESDFLIACAARTLPASDQDAGDPRLIGVGKSR